jgi:hypothetical protein
MSANSHAKSLHLCKGTDPLSVSHSIGWAGFTVPNRASIASTIQSRTMSPVMPPAVAIQLIASRSQQGAPNPSVARYSNRE